MTETTKQPEAPGDLGTAGRRLWEHLHDRFEYRADESLLIEEAARTADVLARLRDDPDDDHVKEIRLQQEMLRKLLGALDYPEDDDGPSMSEWGRKMAHRRWRR